MISVPVASRDQAFCSRAKIALEFVGFETVAAHDTYSAEHALRHHDVQVAVIDAEIPAGDPKQRVDAILKKFPHLRFVVVNPHLLNPERRKLFAARETLFLWSSHSPFVVKAVQNVADSHTLAEATRSVGDFAAVRPWRARPPLPVPPRAEHLKSGASAAAGCSWSAARSSGQSG